MFEDRVCSLHDRNRASFFFDLDSCFALRKFRLRETWPLGVGAVVALRFGALAGLFVSSCGAVNWWLAGAM